MVVYKRANKQYVAMTEDDAWRFLETQSRVYLGLSTTSGYPHVSPIWFVILDRRLYMRAQDYKVKVKLVAESKRACCVIDEGDLYRELRGVIVWGTVRIVTEEELLGRVGEEFEKKYSRRQWRAEEMPKNWVEARTGERKAIIELVPEHIDSWDNRKV